MFTTIFTNFGIWWMFVKLAWPSRPAPLRRCIFCKVWLSFSAHGLGRENFIQHSSAFGLGLFHIRDVDRTFAVNDRAVRVLLALAHVLLDHLQAFDNDALFFGQHGNNLAGLAFFFASENDVTWSPFLT
jgi:hypothetical protein